jgi:hypothetical protein
VAVLGAGPALWESTLSTTPLALPAAPLARSMFTGTAPERLSSFDNQTSEDLFRRGPWRVAGRPAPRTRDRPFRAPPTGSSGVQRGWRNGGPGSSHPQARGTGPRGPLSRQGNGQQKQKSRCRAFRPEQPARPNRSSPQIEYDYVALLQQLLKHENDEHVVA